MISVSVWAKEQSASVAQDGQFVRDGITTDLTYTGEVWNNLSGGVNSDDGSHYTGRFDMYIRADLDKMDFGPGGIAVLRFQDLRGQGITEGITGAHQRISNIDGNAGAGFDLTQLSQFWYERSIMSGRLAVRLGRILADTEFAGATLGADFINTSLGWTHTIPMPAYPDPGYGAVAFFQISDSVGFKAGVWDGAPNGRHYGFSGTGKVFSIYQFTANYALFDSQLPGNSHIGTWYHSGQFEDQAGGSIHDGNYGVYLGLSQFLTKEQTEIEGEYQGLGMFLQFGWAPKDRNKAENYWSGGLVYKGFLPGRDEDSVGIGIGNMNFSGELPVGRSDETMIELFYNSPNQPVPHDSA